MDARLFGGKALALFMDSTHTREMGTSGWRIAVLVVVLAVVAGSFGIGAWLSAASSAQPRPVHHMRAPVGYCIEDRESGQRAWHYTHPSRGPATLQPGPCSLSGKTP